MRLYLKIGVAEFGENLSLSHKKIDCVINKNNSRPNRRNARTQRRVEEKNDKIINGKGSSLVKVNFILFAVFLSKLWGENTDIEVFGAEKNGKFNIIAQLKERGIILKWRVAIVLCTSVLHRSFNLPGYINH